MHAELLRLGLPAPRGGVGDTTMLFDALAALAEAAPAAAWRAAAQRLLAEVLVRGWNAGLADYRLPALLDGDLPGVCAACWPLRPAQPLQATPPNPRGRLVTGVLPLLPNLEPGWGLISVAAWIDGTRPALLLLDGGQDGLRCTPEPGPAPWREAGLARARLDAVRFREDEILHDDADALRVALAPLGRRLRAAIALGTVRRLAARLACLPGGELVDALRSAADRIAQAARGPEADADPRPADGLRQLADQAARLLEPCDIGGYALRQEAALVGAL